MMTYNKLLESAGNPSFNTDLKRYILSYYQPQIQQHIKPQMGGFIDKQSIGLSIINSRRHEHSVQIKCSIFYIEQIGGCNCNDGPHEENGYLEQWLKLDEQQLTFLSQAFIAD